MAFALSRLERIWTKLESTFGTIPTPFAGTNCIRHARFTGMNDVALINRPDKTGTRSQTEGTPGRKFGNWSCEMGLAGPGAAALAAGTAAHVNPLLVALFGQAPVIVGGGGASQTYSFNDAIPSVSIASYRKRPGGYTGADACDRIAHGSVINSAVFMLGQDAASWQISGTCQWILESDRFGDLADGDPGKGGLLNAGGFPAELVADQTDGGLCIGFTGSFSVNAVPMGNIRTAQIRVVTGNEVVRDTFGTFYPTEAIGGERYVTISFSCYDNDTNATSTLRNLANTKTPIDIIMQVGTVAGNIWTFNLNKVQLASPTLNEPGLRYTLDFGDSRAFATDASSVDELTLVLT